MKTTLLFSFLFAGAGAFAQNLPGFYTPQTPAVQYAIVASVPDINQTPAGPDLTWNFNSLTAIGTSVTQTFASATAEFPNTTAVVTTTSTIGTTTDTNDIYLTLPQTGAAITGVTFGDVVLTYSTDNAFIGLFPLTYGYNNSDTVSGTFTGMGATGTFTGTAITQVDAYGSFTANVGGIPAGTAVTRLKITQSLEFRAGFLALGTATQTIYSYYSSQSATDPVFRSTTTALNLPLAGVNETTTVYEIYTGTLGLNKLLANKIAIAPNPVADVLHFAGDTAVTSVTITDISGRIVLQSKSANDISVSHLNTGIYNVAVQSGGRNQALKMIKQ